MAILENVVAKKEQCHAPKEMLVSRRVEEDGGGDGGGEEGGEGERVTIRKWRQIMMEVLHPHL